MYALDMYLASTIMNSCQCYVDLVFDFDFDFDFH